MELSVFSVNTGAVTFTGGTVTGAVTSITSQYGGLTLTYDSASNVWWSANRFPSSSAQIRAWVNFNGTGTPNIRDSFNVSSITDYGTGDYGINFTNAMPNTNYGAAGLASANYGDFPAVLHLRQDTNPLGTSQLRVLVDGPGGSGFPPYDSTYITICVFQ
jgi:hypothetical protein